MWMSGLAATNTAPLAIKMELHLCAFVHRHDHTGYLICHRMERLPGLLVDIYALPSSALCSGSGRRLMLFCITVPCLGRICAFCGFLL